MINTWQDRCMEHPDHQTGMVSHSMIQARMQEEIDELRAALAQPEQEPVAWRLLNASPPVICQQYPQALLDLGVKIEPLYTAPPQRKPLTERETFVAIINDNTDGDGICCADDLLAAIRAHGIGGEA